MMCRYYNHYREVRILIEFFTSPFAHISLGKVWIHFLHLPSLALTCSQSRWRTNLMWKQCVALANHIISGHGKGFCCSALLNQGHNHDEYDRYNILRVGILILLILLSWSSFHDPHLLFLDSQQNQPGETGEKKIIISTRMNEGTNTNYLTKEFGDG